MSMVEQMEAIVKANAERGFSVLMYYHGTDLELYRQTVRDDAYGRVHAKNAGNPVKKIDTFKGAIAGDDFFETSKDQAGTFKKAFLFTDKRDLRPGDEVHLVRFDGRRQRYRLEGNPTVGQTTDVFTKWELSGIM